MRVLPVPRGAEGPDLAVMEQLLRCRTSPRLYVTVSVLHNPTGASLSLGRAHRLLKLAQAHDLHDRRRRHLCASRAGARCRGWPRSTGCSARSTSRVSRRSSRPTGASASSRRRARSSIALIDTQAAVDARRRRASPNRRSRCASSRARCAAMPSGCRAELDAARARSVRLAESSRLPLRGDRRVVCSAGSMSASIPSGWPRSMLDDGWLLAPGTLFHATHRPTHADAHQLRHDAGRALLARPRAGTPSASEHATPRATGFRLAAQRDLAYIRTRFHPLIHVRAHHSVR